jgi:hypothetical protein
MVIYFAEIAGVRAAVDPSGLVEVGVRTPNAASSIEWIGFRTWREVADEFTDLPGRFPLGLCTRAHDGSIVSLSCERDDSLDAEGDEAPLSSADKTRVLELLRESGRPDLAERADPILERATKTDPPPPATSTPAKGRP